MVLLRRGPWLATGLLSAIVALIGVALFAAPAARAGVGTVAGHMAQDSVAPTAAQQRALNRHTRAVSARARKVAKAAVAANPHDVGQWGPVVNWPVVAVHAALLPNGKVLAYDSIGDNATESYPVQDHTRATVWNPTTGSQTAVNEVAPAGQQGFNIFCSGLAHLFDGR